MSKADDLLEAINEAGKKISDKEEKKFKDYVYSFYNPKNKDVLYPVKSVKTLDKAIAIYLYAQRGANWGDGDTVDRENVRTIYDIIER